MQNRQDKHTSNANFGGYLTLTNQRKFCTQDCICDVFVLPCHSSSLGRNAKNVALVLHSIFIVCY